MAKVSGEKPSQKLSSLGDQADAELEKMLAGVDPAVESSLEVLRVSEEHYFAAVHQEGNPLPTAFSSSTEA